MTLTRTDLAKLRLYRWRYCFEAMGFPADTAMKLVFVKFWEYKSMIGGPADGGQR